MVVTGQMADNLKEKIDEAADKLDRLNGKLKNTLKEVRRKEGEGMIDHESVKCCRGVGTRRMRVSCGLGGAERKEWLVGGGRRWVAARTRSAWTSCASSSCSAWWASSTTWSGTPRTRTRSSSDSRRGGLCVCRAGGPAAVGVGPEAAIHHRQAGRGRVGAGERGGGPTCRRDQPPAGRGPTARAREGGRRQDSR